VFIFSNTKYGCCLEVSNRQRQASKCEEKARTRGKPDKQRLGGMEKAANSLIFPDAEESLWSGDP